MKKLKPEFVRKNTSTRLHGIDIPIVALTGGIASGKSSIAGLFKQKGIPVIHADELIKKIYEEESTLHFIKSLAPQVISQNRINFNDLREIFFQNPDLKTKIETYLYQKLPQVFLSSLQSFKNPSWVVYEIPLLFERKLEGFFDLIITINISPENQKKRAIARDHSSKETIERILKAQIPTSEKIKKSDFILDNNIDWDQKNEHPDFNRIWTLITEN